MSRTLRIVIFVICVSLLGFILWTVGAFTPFQLDAAPSSVEPVPCNHPQLCPAEMRRSEIFYDTLFQWGTDTDPVIAYDNTVCNIVDYGVYIMDTNYAITKYTLRDQPYLTWTWQRYPKTNGPYITLIDNTPEVSAPWTWAPATWTGSESGAFDILTPVCTKPDQYLPRIRHND